MTLEYAMSGKAKMKYALGILSLFLFQNAIADEPLSIPETYTTCSESEKFCVIVSIDSDIQAFKRIEGDVSTKPLWKVPGWHRNVFLSNDGVTLVTVYDGYNLIPINYDKHMLMVRIWKAGVLKHKIALNSLINSFSSLERTVSHYNWGYFSGFDKAGDFVITTVENRRLLINLETGSVSE